MRRKIAIWLLVVAMMILASACTKPVATPPPSTEVPSEPKIFRFSDTSDATTLNTHNEVATIMMDIMAYTHSTLYRQVPTADGTAAVYIGDLADGDPIQMDNDGYVWRIKLRKEAKWHNDEPINADTIMYSFKMLMDPKLTNSMANFLYGREIHIVKGFDYYTQLQEGKPAVAWEDVGIKKIDDHTIEITTTQRYRAEDVKRHFTDRSLTPVYEEWYEAGMNDSRTQTTYGSSLNNWMGAGPYFFETWNPEANRVYVKNPDHWLADYFHYDRVEVRVTPDRNARVQLWERGEIDVLALDAVTLERYMDDPRTLTYPTLTVQHMDINSLNSDNPVLQTMDFRRAMYWAMDRATMAELVGGLPAPWYINLQAGAYPEKGITYRMTEEAQALIPPNNGYDPDKAREYFNAALVEAGETMVTVELLYSEANVNTRLVAEYLQQALPEVFGADRFALTLRSVPGAAFWASRDFKQDPNIFDMTFGGWGASLSRVYPYAALTYFVDAYASRPNSFISEDFDKHFAACQAEEVRLNPELMVQMTAELERIYLRDVVHVPLYQNVAYIMYSERLSLLVKDFIPGIGFGVMFADIIQ